MAGSTRSRSGANQVPQIELRYERCQVELVVYRHCGGRLRSDRQRPVASDLPTKDAAILVYGMDEISRCGSNPAR